MPYTKLQKEFLKLIGAHIRSIREAKGISQEQLAFDAGLHRTYIGSVERGERNISLINLKKISDALHLSLDDLLSQTQHKIFK